MITDIFANKNSQHRGLLSECWGDRSNTTEISQRVCASILAGFPLPLLSTIPLSPLMR